MFKKIIYIELIVLLIIASFIVIPFNPVFAIPDNITIYTSADAQILSLLPDENYGDSIAIASYTKTGNNRRSFVKFSLSSIPAGADISLAKLQIYCYTTVNLVSGITDVQARRVADDSWTEMGITWTNQKAYGDVEDTQVPVLDEWMELTITGFVQDEWAGDEVVSLALRCVTEDYDATGRYSYYYAKEYNSGSFKPELYIEYTSPDSKPTYSNVGYDSVTQVGESADFWVFWEDDFALETCEFSTNNTGIWKNDTLTVSGISSWANKTLSHLNYTSNIRVEWIWFCSDNASQWNMTSPNYFLITTPLYITFNFNNSTMGKFKVDNIDTANETQNSYNYYQNILLDGITLSSDYVFNNFTWSGGNSMINNYYYNTSGNNTVWCYFGLSDISITGIDEEYFALGFVIAGCAILFMVIVLKSEKKEK